MQPPFIMFASCLPGLEGLLERELGQIGLSELQRHAGGVEFHGDTDAIYRANLCSGLASHVLVRIGSFPSRHLSHLRQRAAALPWSAVFAPGQTFTTRVTCRRSKLYHSGAVAERIHKAITGSCGASPTDDDDPETNLPAVQVRIHEDVVSIAIDTSGNPLHRRGWRLQAGKAPLREDLARALLLASGWDGTTPLVDPMTGSGTIPIEAAILARRLAPGRLRSFAFEKLALCDTDRFTSVRAEVSEQALASSPSPIFGSDRDAGAIAAATANAERAGVSADVLFAEASVSAAPYLGGEPAPEDRGHVVCNPPYGRRIGSGKNLLPLYQTLGHRSSGLPPGWHVMLCAADRRLALRSGLPLESAFLTEHGGLKIRALQCCIADAAHSC